MMCRACSQSLTTTCGLMLPRMAGVMPGTKQVVDGFEIAVGVAEVQYGLGAGGADLRQALQFGVGGGIDVGDACALVGEDGYGAANLQIFGKAALLTGDFHYGRFVSDFQLQLLAGLVLHADDGQSLAVRLHVIDGAQ